MKWQPVWISIVAALAAVSGARADLLAWWSFNNTQLDSNLDWNDGNDMLRLENGHMHNNNAPFDDGYYNPTSDILFPVSDTFFVGGPGALIGAGALDPPLGAAPAQSNYRAWIDVLNLAGDNFGSGTDDNWGSFGGTDLNRPLGTSAGGSLAITGDGNNGRSFSIRANLTGYHNINVSWANRGTGTGYDSRIVEVASDGMNFSPIFSGLGDLTATWTVHSGTDTANVLANAANATIRFTITGATSDSGNNRFDNIVLSGSLIPEPASGGLAALGLLAAAATVCARPRMRQ